MLFQKHQPLKKLGIREFVSLMALMMSLVALSIDAMLPALSEMAKSLGVVDLEETQLIILVLFLGMSLGQLVYGPLSDAWGRKPTVYLGIFVFILGTLLALFAQSFSVLLVARFLQGFGVASTRVVSMAIIRDQYEGASMARILSLVTMIFILVPAIAPGVGQLILFFFSWRMIFGVLLVLALVNLIWFGLRQPETLSPEKRRPLSIRLLKAAALETVSHQKTVGYTIASGCIFGAFIGYLSNAQQIFQDQYQLGALFPVCFGTLALTIGAAAYTNSRLVMRLGMQKLCFRALLVMSVLSFSFLLALFWMGGRPPLFLFMFYMMLLFFCIGILFGNFNALALESLGHIAGVASAFISSLQMMLSVGLGVLIGKFHDGTLFPLVSGFAGLGFLALLVVSWVERKRT